MRLSSKLFNALLTNWVEILLLNDHSILQKIVNHWHQSSPRNYIFWFFLIFECIFKSNDTLARDIYWRKYPVKFMPNSIRAYARGTIHLTFFHTTTLRGFLLVTFMSTQSSATQWLPLTTSSPGPLPFLLGKSPRDEVVPVKDFRSWGLVENLASPVRLEFSYFVL